MAFSFPCCSVNLECHVKENTDRKINSFIRSQCTPSLLPENIRKPFGYLMFLGDRERVHCQLMGKVTDFIQRWIVLTKQEP